MRGGWSIPYPVVCLPKMIPQSPLVEDPALRWHIGNGAKRRRSTFQPWKSRKPPPPPHFSKNNRIPVSQPEDGFPLQKDHPYLPSRTVPSSRIVPMASLAESERSSFYELSTTTRESCEDESSQESAPLRKIDTQPVGPASVRAQRAFPWRRYVNRQVQDTTEEEK
jgi:hypothetical protein